MRGGFVASSAPLPRYPSTPEIEELDASALEDEDDDECARTLERRVVDHPSVAPTAIDLFTPTPNDSSFSPNARIRSARPTVLASMFIAAAIGTCALLVLCFLLVGTRTSSRVASPRGETRIDRRPAATDPIAISDPAPLPSTATPSLTPLDLPIAKDRSPAQTTRKRTNATGTIRTFHYSMKRLVLVDGRASGYAGSPIVVSCGRHRVQVGTDTAKEVVVPCHGAITVGDPNSLH